MRVLPELHPALDGCFRARWRWSLVNAVGVASGAPGHAVYSRMDTRSIDVMIAETPYPRRLRIGAQMALRHHAEIHLSMQHATDRGYHRALRFQALRRNAWDSARFAWVSDATRRELPPA